MNHTFYIVYASNETRGVGIFSIILFHPSPLNCRPSRFLHLLLAFPEHPDTLYSHIHCITYPVVNYPKFFNLKSAIANYYRTRRSRVTYSLYILASRHMLYSCLDLSANVMASVPLSATPTAPSTMVSAILGLALSFCNVFYHTTLLRSISSSNPRLVLDKTS
jgi:hypothetical protein